MTKADRDRFPCLSLDQIRRWRSRDAGNLDQLKAMESEIAKRKSGRPKPRRYEIARENYHKAVKAFQDVIAKTDLQILSERLNELEADDHEAKLIRAIMDERFMAKYPGYNPIR